MISKALNKKLTKKLKNKWIKALESDNYEQCTDTLQDSEGANCCLGVLCRVMRIKHKNFNQCNTLSEAEMGLDKVLSKGVENTLVKMNDSGKTFEEIAEFLKKNKKI